MSTRTPHLESRSPARCFTLAAAAAALLAVMLFASLDARSAEDGRVTGVVINGTTEQPVSGVEVTISRFEQVGPASVDLTTTTDATGRFTFEGLDTSEGYVYAASTRHATVLYSTGMLLLSQSPQQEVEIRVFDATADQSVVTIQARGIIVSNIDAESGVITVTDLSVISNDSMRTYTGDDDGRTLRFHVPGDAIEVTPRPGFDFTTAMIEDATVFTTNPVRPGVESATLDYTIPYSGTFARILIQSSYRVETVRILAPASEELDGIGVAVQGGSLTEMGRIDIEGNQYHVWVVDGLRPGGTLDISLSGLPGAAVVHNELRSMAPALIALSFVVLATGITGAIVVRRGLHRRRPVVLQARVATPLDERRAELAEQLRALEALRLTGDIDEIEYRASRRPILEGLRIISRQYRGIGEDE
ncbi:MAG TPA: hypothetical protein VMM78_09270 [Thermomicrobiales bacterium]|nr:hypothetical protein [Thermomicrobiales bacterium]